MPSIVPHFNSEFIFGDSVTMVTIDPPREVQVNAFLGINGIEELDLGQRQRYTDVTGRLIGVDEFALGLLENRFRLYKNQYAYVLYTTEGLTWFDVKLESFQPMPRIYLDAATGAAFRTYKARFKHLR